MVPIRVIIADDQKVCRLGLSTMLKGAPGIELVAEAVSGEALLILVAQHKPDVVLTDIEMSPINGLEGRGGGLPGKGSGGNGGAGSYQGGPPAR